MRPRWRVTSLQEKQRFSLTRRMGSGTQALLGLLTIAPMSGYDLGRAVRSSVGHIWNESYGQIYPNLKKLAARDFVEARLERQDGKPDRKIYSITALGRKELDAWLAQPPQPEVPRNELLLKLFFGVQAPTERLIEYVEQMAEQHRSLLGMFERIEREEIAPNRDHPDAMYWRMTARFGQLEMEAHLRWADETLAELRKLVKQRS